MYYQSALNRINELESKLQAIITNVELSNDGKNRARKTWAAEKLQARADALAALRADVSVLRRQFIANENRRAEAQDTLAKSWNYQRLQYELAAVQAMVEAMPSSFPIGGMDPVLEFKKRYEAVKHGMDLHKRRAFCEFGSAYFQSHSQDNARAVPLVNLLQQDLAEMMTGPELEAVEAEGTRLAETALAVVEAIKKCRDYYDQNGVFGVMSPSEFNELLTGIKIERGDIESATGRFKITVTIDGTANMGNTPDINQNIH